MSSQVVFTQSNIPNAFTMDTIFHMADCCRACLRVECSLTPTVAEDNDSVKFCDKLSACVTEVVSVEQIFVFLNFTDCVDGFRFVYLVFLFTIYITVGFYLYLKCSLDIFF